jgi:hypothetical protein
MAWTPTTPIVAGKFWYDPNGHHQSGHQKHELRIVAIRPDAYKKMPWDNPLDSYHL